MTLIAFGIVISCNPNVMTIIIANFIFILIFLFFFHSLLFFCDENEDRDRDDQCVYHCVWATWPFLAYEIFVVSSHFSNSLLGFLEKDHDRDC